MWLYTFAKLMVWYHICTTAFPNVDPPWHKEADPDDIQRLIAAAAAGFLGATRCHVCVLSSSLYIHGSKECGWWLLIHLFWSSEDSQAVARYCQMWWVYLFYGRFHPLYKDQKNMFFLIITCRMVVWGILQILWQFLCTVYLLSLYNFLTTRFWKSACLPCPSLPQQPSLRISTTSSLSVETLLAQTRQQKVKSVWGHVGKIWDTCTREMFDAYLWKVWDHLLKTPNDLPKNNPTS